MIFKSSCYHPRLTVYEQPSLTETIVNCVQDIVYTWATEALGGQGQAALSRVRGAERASLLQQEMRVRTRQRRGRQLPLRAAVLQSIAGDRSR